MFAGIHADPEYAAAHVDGLRDLFQGERPAL